MRNILNSFGSYLEKLNDQKDQLFFYLVKPYWPRAILPNHLTIFRIIIGGILFFLLFVFKNYNGFIILPLFFIGAITDLLDGVIARCLQKETKFGKTVDPIADRILILPIAIYSLIENQYLIIVFLVMEIINTLVSAFSHDKEIFFGSNIFGKTKMFLQSIVFIGILLLWPQKPNPIFINLLWLSVILMLFSTISKLTYIKEYYDKKH